MPPSRPWQKLEFLAPSNTQERPFEEAFWQPHRTDADGAHTVRPPEEVLWAVLRCTRCAFAVGAMRLEAAAARERALGGRVGEAPAWFDERMPNLRAGEPPCSLQLLKCRVGARPPRAVGAAGAVDTAGTEGVAGLFDAMDTEGTVVGGQDAAAARGGAFSAHSLCSTLGGRMLREAEEHGVRNFAFGEGGREPLLLVTLLCPYLTLHTNRSLQPPCAATAGDAPPRSSPHGGASSGLATDAIKVMWATLGPAAESAAEGEPEAAATAAAAAAAWRQWVEDGSMLRLHLLEGECGEVLDWLRVAALALPPSTRRVGAFNVGHMPIVPSWD